MSAEEFSERGAGGVLGARRVSVGANFRFGHRAAGDAALLQAPAGVRDRGRAAGRRDGEAVSSSRIRKLIVAGDVAAAAHAAGGALPARGRSDTGRRPRP